MYWKINTLFCEGENKNVSVGRVGLWLVLFPAIHLWWAGEDIQTNHLYVLGFLLLYNSYKKIPLFIDLIKALLEIKKK